jgi:septal ring factor EnvC (AmiA/AmiB activator)
MRSTLIAHADKLDQESILGYAATQSLDAPRFKACLDSDKYHAAIQALYGLSREKDAQLRQQQKQIAALARSSGEKDEQIRKLLQQVQELQKVQQRMASLEARLARHEAEGECRRTPKTGGGRRPSAARTG